MWTFPKTKRKISTVVESFQSPETSKLSEKRLSSETFSFLFPSSFVDLNKVSFIMTKVQNNSEGCLLSVTKLTLVPLKFKQKNIAAD